MLCEPAAAGMGFYHADMLFLRIKSPVIHLKMTDFSYIIFREKN